MLLGNAACPADYALQHIVNRMSESLLSCDTAVPGLKPAMTHQESHSCTPDLQQAMMHRDTDQVQSKQSCVWDLTNMYQAQSKQWKTHRQASGTNSQELCKHVSGTTPCMYKCATLQSAPGDHCCAACQLGQQAGCSCQSLGGPAAGSCAPG